MQPHARRLLFWGALLFWTALVFVPAAQAQIAGMVNSIPDAFNQVRGMEGALRIIALELFAGLVAIEVCFAIGFMWMGGNATLPNILGMLMRQGLMIGFFALLIQTGPDICRNIILGMAQAGNQASQAIGGSANMSPGDVIGIGANMVRVIWDAMTWNPKSLVLLLCGAIVIWTFAEITCAIIEVMVEGYLFASWSALMMGFGGNAYTRELAIGQLRLALSIGAKRFVLQCIVGLGESLMRGWSTGIRSGTVDLMDCVAMVVVSVIVWRLARSLPQRAQDMICGHHTGANYTGAGGMAQQGVNAAAGAGKAAVATAAMGAAAGAAYGQAKAQLEATGGGSSGSSGASSSGSAGSSPSIGSTGSSGLGASLSRGMQLAALTASNMGSAAATDMGNRLAGERSTSHGFLGARMARISGKAAAQTRASTAAAMASTSTPANAP